MVNLICFKCDKPFTCIIVFTSSIYADCFDRNVLFENSEVNQTLLLFKTTCNIAMKTYEQKKLYKYLMLFFLGKLNFLSIIPYVSLL